MTKFYIKFLENYRKDSIMDNKFSRVLCIYSIPICLFILYFFLHEDYIRNTWLLLLIGFIFLIYCDYCSFNKKKDKIRDSIIIRKFYFSYFYFFLIFIFPYIKHTNFIFKNTHIFGLSDMILSYFILLILGILAYIFIISDSHITEISMGSAKITMLKEQFEKDLDEHIDLTYSLIDKIKAEFHVIQNLAHYCHEASNNNGIIIEEFQKILQIYFEHQKEREEVFVIEHIDTTIKTDFKLKDVEYKELLRHMNRNELYAVKTDKHYMFLPYIEESFEEILGEPLKIFIIIESDQAIIKQERYIILNILKEFYEKLLVNIYID